MNLTITNRKYYRPSSGPAAVPGWQTAAVAEDVALVLRRHSVEPEITSDDAETLVSWSTPQTQLWIGITCLDAEAPCFQLNIGAGKRVWSMFAKAFPDSIFAGEPWVAELQQLNASPNG